VFKRYIQRVHEKLSLILIHIFTDLYYSALHYKKIALKLPSAMLFEILFAVFKLNFWRGARGCDSQLGLIMHPHRVAVPFAQLLRRHGGMALFRSMGHRFFRAQIFWTNPQK